MMEQHQSARPEPSDGSVVCPHCAAIDFSYLQLPTLADIRYASSGCSQSAPLPPYLASFRTRRLEGRSSGLRYSLGAIARVEQSARSCPLCATVLTAMPSPVRAARDTVVVLSLEGGWSHWRPQELTRELFPRSIFGPQVSNHCGTNDQDGEWEQTFRAMNFGSGFELFLLGLNVYSLDDQNGLLSPGLLEQSRFKTEGAPLKWGCSNWAQAMQDPADVLSGGDESNVADSRSYYGGRRQSAMIDPGLVRGWLDRCLRDHQACAGTLLSDSTGRITPMFRLVDAVNWRIETFRDVRISQLRYLALSYVWGRDQSLMLLTSNNDALSQPGALQHRASRTISDAIHLASRVGVRYIWIDALCILQDSSVDKALQLPLMGIIYQHALFTVVAASGKDCHAGLPGVTEPRAIAQREVSVPGGVKLVTTLRRSARSPLDHWTAGTVWATRAWTFQEKTMSRRVLLVTEQQAFWECLGGYNFCEDTVAECSHGMLRFEHPFALDRPGLFDVADDSRPSGIAQLDTRRLETYCRVVHDYGLRDLTNQGDAYDAFSALANQFSLVSGSGLVWGLPTRRFEEFLCWKPTRVLGRRSAIPTLAHLQRGRNMPFPSWSWVGWRGQCDLTSSELKVSLDASIRCYILRGDPPRLVSISQPGSSATGKEDVTLSMVEEGKIPNLHLQAIQDLPDDQVLFFWAESASFRLEPPVILTEESGWYREVVNEQGSAISGVFVAEPTPALGGATETAEFVLIGREGLSGKTCLVLHVERLPDGLAERRGIAEISYKNWEKAGPKRKLIALS